MSNIWAQSSLADKFYKNGLEKMKQGNYNEAITDFNSAIKENPTNIDYYLDRGYVFQNIEQYDNALKDYNKVIEIDNSDGSGYNNRGLLKRVLKDYDGALKDMDMAISIDPKNAVHIFNRGVLKVLTDDYISAMMDFNKTIMLDPKEPYYYVERCRLKTKLNDYRGAIADVNIAITLDQRYIYDKGYANFEFEKYSEAMSEFTKAINMGVMKPESYNMRAMTKKELGDLKGACEDWSIAGELGEIEAYTAMKRFCKNR